MKGLDFYSKRYGNDVAPFLVDIKEREQETTRKDVPANKVRFVSLANAVEKCKGAENLAKRLNVDISLVEDTSNHAKMVVVIDGEPFLLGSSSWVSISGRIDIYGAGFAALEPEDKAYVLNARLRQLDNNNIKVIVVSGKVRAIMSAKYSVVPADEVFEAILEKAKERFADVSCITSYYDHDFSYTKLLFPELAKKISEAHGLPDTLIPGLLVVTSDTGHAGIKVTACWQYPQGAFQQADNEVYLRHENSNGIDKVLDAMPNLFIKYQNAAVKLATMMNIELKYPATVLKKACKALGVGDKYAKSLMVCLPTSNVTAYDICMEMFSLPARISCAEAPKLVLEEKVAKAINLNYEKLDED